MRTEQLTRLGHRPEASDEQIPRRPRLYVRRFIPGIYGRIAMKDMS